MLKLALACTNLCAIAYWPRALQSSSIHMPLLTSVVTQLELVQISIALQEEGD